MSTYTQSLYQIVFATKNRGMDLSKDNRRTLYKYAWGLLKNKGCHLYQINGIEDHLHIATALHPSVALADLVKDLKLSCSRYIKDKNLFKQQRMARWLRSIYLFNQ